MHRREALRLGAVGLVGSGVVYGVATGSGDRNDPTNPYEPLGSVDIDGTAEVVTSDDGTTAYVATTTGYATVDISDPTTPTVLADVREPLSDRSGGPLYDILDLDCSGDRLLVAGPAHNHDADLRAALLVDVADPANPTRLAVFETDYHLHNVLLEGDYAYLCGNEMARNPLVIVDVADPTDPHEEARWSILDAEPDWEPVAPILRYLHDVWVHDGVAVLAYWDAGTWLVDVSEPTQPTFQSRFGPYEPADLAGLSTGAVDREQQSLPGNAHYGATDPTNSVLALGREAWSVDHEGQPRGSPGGIELYDISEPSAPRQLATIEPPETPDASFDGVWTSAHNFELSTDRLYSSWYDGGMMIHDITDPADPTRIAAWRDPERLSFWTAQQAVDGESVVASSMDRRNKTPGLWIFPDRAGQQPDRPEL
jgi:hypothetical protein